MAQRARELVAWLAVSSNTKRLSDEELGRLDAELILMALLGAQLPFPYFIAFPGAMEELYNRFQPSFFTGFLTLGGLLLTSKVFIISNLKKDIYDSDAYHQRLGPTGEDLPLDQRFKPLYNAQRAIVSSIVMALLASIAQISLGSLPSALTKAAACSTVAVAFCGALRSLLILQTNTIEWFSQMETTRIKQETLAAVEAETARKDTLERMAALESKPPDVEPHAWAGSPVDEQDDAQ